LASVLAPHPTQPLLALFDPPIEPTTTRPRGHLDLDRRIDFPAISLRTPLQIVVAEVHN
jgi:hypothetical protein